MSKKIFVLCLISVLMVPAISFAAEFTLKFGHLANEEHTWHKAAMKFADLVAEKSNGRIEVKVYPNEQLGKELDTITSIQMGTADMVISGGSMINWAPRIGVMECPTVIRDSAHLQKVAGGEIGQEIEAEIREKIGLRAIGWFERGPRNLTSNTPIKTPDDVQGMILRVPNSPLYVNISGKPSGRNRHQWHFQKYLLLCNKVPLMDRKTRFHSLKVQVSMKFKNM